MGFEVQGVMALPTVARREPATRKYLKWSRQFLALFKPGRRSALPFTYTNTFIFTFTFSLADPKWSQRFLCFILASELRAGLRLGLRLGKSPGGAALDGGAH